MNENSPNISPKFSCIQCDIETNNKKDFNKHLLTAKHINRTTLNINDPEKDKFICKICNKVYKARNSLWYHEKKCKAEQDNIVLSITENDNNLLSVILKENSEFKNLVLEVVKNNSELLKQNQEFQKQTQELNKQVLDVCQKIQPVTQNNNINNNSHNKTFNLNFFLNEQCKDAMNLMDFVDTIQLKISDMERIGELGYVEGISSIIMENLNGMDIYKRPIHCSDAKRETMHIKDKGIWEKDTVNNDKMRKAIKHITWLNSKLLFAWAAEHPGVVYSDHKLNDKYCEMIVEAMGGKRNKSIEEGESKIIKKISRMVLINKE